MDFSILCGLGEINFVRDVSDNIVSGYHHVVFVVVVS
jgi:hypothetical protein